MIGRRFRINLSESTWAEVKVPKQWIHTYGGGTGLALKAFREEPSSRGKPRVVFAPGLLTGTSSPACHWSSAAFYDAETRRVVVPYFGGDWGAHLRLFGAALLEIEGKSPRANVLVLEDGQVRFVEDQTVTGLSPRDTVVRLKDVLGTGYHIACIGCAGEMELPMASLVCDGTYQRHSGGLGTMFGRMGLKAIAVKGHDKIVPADPASFHAQSKTLRRLFSQEYFPYRQLSSYGSAWFLSRLYEEAVLPVKNFTTTVFPDWQMLSGAYLADVRRRQRVACFGCPVGCRSLVRVSDAWYNGLELEEVIALGTLCGISSADHVVRIKARCDDLGIDPLAFGGALAASMEAGEKGRNHPVTFGDGAKVIAILDEEHPDRALKRLKITADNGTLSRGPSRVEFITTDPRADQCLALNRMTWPSHEPHGLSSAVVLRQLPLFASHREETDPARFVRRYQIFYAGLQSLGCCPWTALTYTPAALDPLVHSALGGAEDSGSVVHFGDAALKDAQRDLARSATAATRQFGKLASQMIGDGPRKGQRLDMRQLWRDYLTLAGVE